MVVRIAAGEQRRTGRLADRALGPGLIKADAFCRQAVEVGCDDDVVTRTAQNVGAMLIGVDEEQIGLLLGLPVIHWPTPSHEMIPCFRRMPLDL